MMKLDILKIFTDGIYLRVRRSLDSQDVYYPTINTASRDKEIS